VLQEQHDTVNMFVRSKAGEIKRRLDHLHKIVVQLRRRTDGTTKKHMSVRRVERYSRIENDALKAGEEVQSLARFVTAQEQAFRKLLKKYKKWTGSPRLVDRFQKEVLARPTVFTQSDIVPLLAQYEDVLEALRVPFKAGLSWGADGAQRAAEQTLPSGNGEHGSNLELDAALATIPLGRNAGCASYWVHPENVLQLHILILQHARLRAHGDRSSRSPPPQSPTSTRKSSLNGTTKPLQPESDSDVNLMCFDHLDAFARRRSGMTVKDLETRPGRRLEEATATIRCGPSDDAVVCVQPSNVGQASLAHKPTRILQSHVPKRKVLRSVFDPDSQQVATSSDAWPDSLREISNWYTGRPEVKPLVRICAKRSRFVGLNNSSKHGLWITLDREVTISSLRLEHIDGAPAEEVPEAEHFPHAILNVRWEGQACPGLVNVLDNSHLVCWT
jgi:hypothetical protein